MSQTSNICVISSWRHKITETMEMSSPNEVRGLDDFGREIFQPSKGGPQENFQSPNNKPVGLIGKLDNGEWGDHELSPIVANRDSLSGNDCTKMEGEELKEPNKCISKGQALTSSNINVAQITTEGKLGKRDVASWFLATDSTSPLSTSSEFSLESLRDCDKSKNSSLVSSEEKDTSTLKSDYEVAEKESSEADISNQEECRPLRQEPSLHQTRAKSTGDVDTEINTSKWENNGNEQRRLSTLSSDDVLVQDATEKVKKFIYELSMSSSRLSLDESYANEERRQQKSAVGEFKEDQQAKLQTEASNKNSNMESPSTKTASSSSNEDSALGGLSKCVDWSSPVRTERSSFDAGLSKTPGSQDLSIAKKELGASSFAFLNQVRGAAQRRKQNFTRSRDSLFAKEQKHREEIASSKRVLASEEVMKGARSSSSKSLNSTNEPPLTNSKSSKVFKAKPVPSSIGMVGSGGMVGVPKVTKKQPTIPSSPLLGSRRPGRPKIKALEEPSTKPRVEAVRKPAKEETKRKPLVDSGRAAFKARAAPPTTGILGHSGQVGVPKVPKRPVTVPYSPSLGPRRRRSTTVGNIDKENVTQNRRASTGMMLKPQGNEKSSRTRNASPVLVSSYTRFRVVKLCWEQRALILLCLFFLSPCCVDVGISILFGRFTQSCLTRS